MQTQEFQDMWTKSVFRIGTATLITASVASLVPIAYLMWRFQINLEWNKMFFTWMKLCAAFGALYVVEPIAYYSSLGYAGTYLAFLSGNIGNLRVPCAYMALKATGTPPNTKEAEVISTLGISGSIIINLLIVAAGAILSGWILSVTPEALKDAFRRFITPAVYGAMIGQIGLSLPKLLPSAILFPVGARLFFPWMPGWIINIAAILIHTFLAYYFYFRNYSKK